MLAAQMAAEPLPARPAVLDLCTGSGVLAISAARRHPDARVVAVDISRRAVLAVRLNARLNGVRVESRRGNLFEAVAGERFDLICSNPPYIPGPVSDLPRRGLARAWEGGPSGRAVLDRICAAAADHLKPGGRVFLVHNAMCDEQATIEALRERGVPAEVVFRHQGKLGPILQARVDWLRRNGLLEDGDDSDEVVIVRGQRQAEPGQARNEPAQARNEPAQAQAETERAAA
jgi:release factor glutamine methyltransferase